MSSLIQAIARAASAMRRHERLGRRIAERSPPRPPGPARSARCSARPVRALQLDSRVEQHGIGGVERGLVVGEQHSARRLGPLAARARRACRRDPPSGRARAGRRPHPRSRGARRRDAASFGEPASGAVLPLRPCACSASSVGRAARRRRCGERSAARSRCRGRRRPGARPAARCTRCARASVRRPRSGTRAGRRPSRRRSACGAPASGRCRSPGTARTGRSRRRRPTRRRTTEGLAASNNAASHSSTSTVCARTRRRR